MDVSKLKANGPWVLVDPEVPTSKTDGGIYLPQGNLLERLGHVVAKVVSAGPGFWDVNEHGKDVFVHTQVKTGDRVVFRGHLKAANQVGYSKLCFMHAKDLVGILGDDSELNLALPYDN